MAGILGGIGGIPLQGTNTNDNAPAGCVGEVISSAASANAPSTGQYGDLTSINLTAGDWLVTAQGEQVTTPTATEVSIGISTTAGNFSTGLTGGDNQMTLTKASGAFGGVTVANYRMSLSGSATVYLKMNAVYGSGTAAGNAFVGRITAVRIR